jgi:Nitrate/nitrite transporter
MPTALPVLLAISFCHLLNDMMQALLPAMYPMLKAGFHLDFGQIGLITFTFQLTASLLQPIIGLYTDHHPKPYSLMAGMGFTFAGLLLLSATRTYPGLLAAAGLVGLGSAVFHPESSRVARMASGGRHGFAQSLFQVGGNTGSAIGPWWRRSSCCRGARGAWPGSPWRRWSPFSSSGGWAAGTGATAPAPRRLARPGHRSTTGCRRPRCGSRWRCSSC